MLIVEKIDKKFTISCHFIDQCTLNKQFVYSIANLSLDEVAQYLLGRGHEDIEEEVTTLFNLTNITKAYISDTGKVSAVRPL